MDGIHILFVLFKQALELRNLMRARIAALSDEAKRFVIQFKN
jgi:hypothetical protein